MARPRPPLVALQTVEVWHGVAHGVELIARFDPLRLPGQSCCLALLLACRFSLFAVRDIDVPGLGLVEPFVGELGFTKPRFGSRQAGIWSCKRRCRDVS